jgi:tripartite-type tricarboxylate transporter receptor subunit TctC
VPRFFIASILAVVSLVVCASVAAQDYPARPIRLIIPLGAGGGGDVFARALADELSKTLHQPVIVENRPGGALNIGTRACAESAPDGYTVCVLSSEPMVYNQFAFKNLPFDPEKDFEPISLLFFNTLALVTNRSLEVRTIPELVALSKAKPGTLSYGTFSFPLAHFMEKLKQETGADIVRIPFRSGSEVVNAVLSGSTPVAILALSNMVPQLQSGHITALVVTGKTRSPLFPISRRWRKSAAAKITPPRGSACSRRPARRSRSSRDSRMRSRALSMTATSGNECTSIVPSSRRGSDSRNSRASFATSARPPNASSERRARSRNRRAEFELAPQEPHPSDAGIDLDHAGTDPRGADGERCIARFQRPIPHSLHSSSKAIFIRSTAAA